MFRSEAERRRFESQFFESIPEGHYLHCGHVSHPKIDVPAVCMLTVTGILRLGRKGFHYRPVCETHKQEAIKILTRNQFLSENS